MLGSSTGTVHRQQQGNGLATVLRGNEAVDTYGRLAIQSQAKRAALDAKEAAKRDEAMKKLTAFQPEYFYKDKTKLQPLIEKHIAAGAEFLASNRDPWSSGEADAVEWQKEHQRLTALSALSKQKQKEYEAFRQDIDGKDPNDYIAGDIENANKWFDMDLEEMAASSATRPPLRKKQAWEDAFEFIGKGMRTWTSSGKSAPSDPEILDFVSSSMADPANAKYVQSYAQKFSTSSPEEQARIKEAAKAQNIEPFQVMAFEDAKRWTKGQEPLDMLKEMEAAAKAAEGRVDWVEGGNEKADYSQPVKGSVAKSAATVANDLFASRQDWLTVYDKSGELPRGKEEDTGSYAARVKAYMAKQIETRMSVKTKYSIKSDYSSGSGKRVVETRDEWIKDMRSGDVITADSASKILLGSTFAQNLKVDRAVVNTAPNKHQFLRLEMGTNLSLDEVKKSIVDSDTGLVSESVTVEDRQGKRVAIIDLGAGDIANQTLGRLYDNYHKETGSYYDPALTERGIRTAAGIIPSMPTQATAKTKTAPLNDF